MGVPSEANVAGGGGDSYGTGYWEGVAAIPVAGAGSDVTTAGAGAEAGP